MYNKSDVISNIDNVIDSGMAIICEGKMDSLKIGPRSLHTWKSYE